MLYLLCQPAYFVFTHAIRVFSKAVRIYSRVLFVYTSSKKNAHTIWYPVVTIAAVMGLAIACNLVILENEKMSMRTSLFMWYFVSWNVASYIMGDPVPKRTDAVLVLTAVFCSGSWLYEKAQIEKRNT